jgi:hypothetical protein
VDDLQDQRDRSDYETDHVFASSVDLDGAARLALVLVEQLVPYRTLMKDWRMSTSAWGPPRCRFTAAERTAAQVLARLTSPPRLLRAAAARSNAQAQSNGSEAADATDQHQFPRKPSGLWRSATCDRWLRMG